MAAPKPRTSRSKSLRDAPDLEKIDASCSWDALEWTKIEPVSRSVSRVKLDCLLEAEQVIAEGYGVVLVNSDEAGTLFVTNFRLLFLSEGTMDVIALGTIPLAAIEKFNKIVVKTNSVSRQSEKSQARRLLQVIGKDMRIIVFGFRPKTKQRRKVYDALFGCMKPARIWDLYAFQSGPSNYSNADPKVRLLNEYFRLLGKSYLHASMSMIEDGSFTLSNDLWRITNINTNYTLCPSYPFALVVPKHISDGEILQASTFRARCRLPVLSWCNPGTGAVLARSSQPLVGLMMNMRSTTDEKLVAGLCSHLAGARGSSRRKLYIAEMPP